MRVLFRLGSAQATIDTNDADLAERFVSLFPGSRIHRLSELPKPAPLLVAERGEEGPFLIRDGVADRPETLMDLVSEVEFAVATGLLSQLRNMTHIHGAAANTPGGTVLGFGPPGAGKSSLALAWSKAGYPLLGDDVVLLDEEGQVRPFPRLVSVNAERMRELEIPMTENSYWEPGEEEGWFDPRTQAGWATGPSSVTLLAEVEFQAGVGVKIEPVTGAQRLASLLSAVHQMGVSRANSVDRIIKLLGHAPMVSVRFDSSRTAAETLADMAASGPPAG